MQKLTCKIIWNSVFSRFIKVKFRNISQIEILEVLKENLDKGENIGVCKIVMDEDKSINQLKLSKYYEIMEVIEKNDDEYICMVKVSTPPYFSKFLELMELEIIWQGPIIMNTNFMTFNCLGSSSSLKRVLNLFKIMGTITQISFNDAEYDNHKILFDLTQKEEEVLLTAIHNGYYEYPRKINATELANIIKTSKSTVIEHLRKAENKVMLSAINNQL